MNKRIWIRISERKPKKGQPIVLYNKQEGYIGNEKHIDKMSIPFLTRWDEKEYPDKKEMRIGDCVIYTIPVYWYPIPELIEEEK